MNFREFNHLDFDQVKQIYKEGLSTGMSTFETKAPSWEDWDSKHLSFARIAAFEGDKMLGWVALSKVSTREVYKGIAEFSVYISSTARGRGLGTKLVQRVIESSEENGIWTLQSSVFRENKGSISLHEKCGFRKIGYREKVAQLNGVWKDNIIFERRSKIIGV